MLRVNDDCLASIFDKLKLRDQLRLTAVNERFRDIIVSVQWRSRFRSFEPGTDLDFVWDEELDTLSRREFQSLLMLIAPGIESLFIPRDAGWRSWPSLYIRFKFPVLRRLKCHLKFNEGDMQLLAANCPQIEELHLYNRIEGNPIPYIVQMRHLSVLQVEDYTMSVCDLQKILKTLPLTKLWVKGFLKDDDPRLLAEMCIGDRDLMFLRIDNKNTEDIMEYMMALASGSECRNPLTSDGEESIVTYERTPHSHRFSWQSKTE